MNIVSTVMQFLTPMITNKIASSLGINNSLATTAIGALIPAILAGLAGKAGTPAGASALADVLGKQDPGLLGSFAGMLGGAGQNALITNGTSALSGLLGGSSTNALAGAVAKFAGVDSGISSNLIGMLAPVVVGSLAQTQKSSGLDAGGLAKMLDGQKGNIAAALPAGFGDLLKGSGLLDSVAGQMRTAAPSAPKVEMPKMPSMPDAPSFNWMPWAAGAAGLLALFWAFGGGNNKPAPLPAAVEKAAAPAAPAAAPAAASATQAMDEAKKIFGGLTGTLGNIKDAATAQAALPQLTASSTALDGFSKLAASFAPDTKTQIKALVAATMPQLSPMVDTVLKIPGAEAILKPVLDAIMSKMTGLSKI